MAAIPSLPEVTEDFQADGTQFIATLEAIAAAADRAAEAVARLHALEKGITDALTAQAGAAAAAAAGMSKAADADNAASRAAAAVAAAAGAAADAERGQAAAAAEVAATTGAAAAAAHDLAVAEAAAAAAEAVAAGATRDAAAAAAELAVAELAAAAAADHSGAAMGTVGAFLKTVYADTIGAAAAVNIFGIGWTALHWILAGSFELLATLIPALIAFGAGMTVAAQGAMNVASHMKALYTATEATHAVLGQTAGDVLGLGHALQTAQNQANPGVYELLGAALNSLQGHMGNLAQAGLQVVHMFDQFAAKVTVDMQGALGAQIQGLISNMVVDLQQFGQILGNLGHALLNFASAMPGLAQVLLSVADGISKVILFASQGGALITFGMALEEVFRWGGLVASMLVRLTGGLALMNSLGATNFVTRFGAAMITLAAQGGSFIAWIGTMVGRLAGLSTAFGSAGTAMVTFGGEMRTAALALTPGMAAGIIAAVAALGILIYALGRVQNATQQWIDTQSKALSQVSDLQLFNTLNAQMAQTAAQYDALTSKAGGAAGAMRQVGAAAGRLSRDAMATVSPMAQLDAYQQRLAQTARTASSNVSFLANVFHTSAGAAVALANAAGVNLQQAFSKGGTAALLALTQIVNLERGLGAMGAPVGTLGNDMNVLGIQSQLAASKVAQLNQAWDQWIQSVTGGMQALSQFETALTTMQSDVAGTSASLSGAFTSIGTGASNMTYTLKGFGPAAMQSWQQFTSAVQQGNTVLDSLRTGMAEGVVSNQMFTGSVKAMVGQLAPFTQGNAAAVTMLRNLAAEAGGPANGSLRQLEHWAGVTGNAARDQLGRGLEAATVAMGSMGKVASNLSANLSGQVNAAIAKTIYNTSGLATAVTKYSKDAQAAHPSQATLHSDLQGIASAMQKATTQSGQFAQGYVKAQDAAAKAATSVAKSTTAVTSAAAAADKAKIAAVDHATAMLQGASAASSLAGHTNTASSATQQLAGHTQTAAQRTQEQGQRAQTAAQQIQHMAQEVLTAGGNALTAAGKMITLAAAEARAGSAAAVAAGQVRSLGAAISALQSKTITVTTNYVTHGGGLGSPIIGIPGHAAGVASAAAGLAMVGETGPELVRFGGGERVYSHADTMALLNSRPSTAGVPASGGYGGGGGGDVIDNHVHVYLDGREIFTSVKREAARYSTRNSGSRTGLLIPGTSPQV